MADPALAPSALSAAFTALGAFDPAPLFGLSLFPYLAFLWDDNRDIAGEFHVLTVPEYVAVPPSLEVEIHSELEVMFPKRHLDTHDDRGLISVLKGAPPGCCSYDAAANLLFVQTADKSVADWPVPDIPAMTEELVAMFFALVAQGCEVN